MLNVTVEDLLNARNAVDAFTYDLMKKFKVPLRALDRPSDTDEKDFRVDALNGKWTPVGLAESKARKFYDPPLVSKRKIDLIWGEAKASNLSAFVILWFDIEPSHIYWIELSSDYLTWAAQHIEMFGHGKRKKSLREPGYPFPLDQMSKCFAFAKRLNSPNSKR